MGVTKLVIKVELGVTLNSHPPSIRVLVVSLACAFNEVDTVVVDPVDKPET